MDCRVEAGVHRKQLNEYIRETGLFFPVDPGADATLGGMAATGASGTTTVRYGAMRQNVLGLRAVMADGTVVNFGGRARKSSAGYDLTKLLIGSEGTLGIITELQLRLHPNPEETSAARVTFNNLADAVQTVTETMQVTTPARMELICPMSIRSFNSYSKTNFPEAYTLFFEFHGSATSVQEQAEMVEEIAGGNSGSDFEWTKD